MQETLDASIPPLGGAQIDWTGGTPRSTRYGDIYFSPEDGLAESRAVFLDGLGLPEAWAGRGRFTVGELGFGTGLNVLALLQRWSQTRPAPLARLNVFSVEAHPLPREDARRALAAWPELAPWAGPLLDQWPCGATGLHRIDWPGAGASLDLAVADVAEALETWSGAADAWMIDGFSPATNPSMWTPALMAQVAARSAAGARAATFTVAGSVRRGLQAAGFAVERRPGHGRKRERLEARLPGTPSEPRTVRNVAVIGGGIAGAALARALVREGCTVDLVEGERPGANASGFAAALVTPRLDSGFGAAAVLHAQALSRACALYDRETPDAVLARGSLQLEAAPRDSARFDRLAGWAGFPHGAMVRLAPAEAAAALGEAQAPGALGMEQARVVEPAAVLAVWLRGVRRIAAPAASAHPTPEGRWRVLDEGGSVLVESDAIVIAAGPASGRFVEGLPLEPVRGQVSMIYGEDLGGAPAAWGGYAVPTRAGLLFGATHDRGDGACDVREGDALRNDAALAKGRPRLAARVAASPFAARTERAAVRAATPDRSPLAGALAGAPGRFVLGGLGGRGFTLAPLLAEHVAALVIGAPSPLPAACAALVDPARFDLRPEPRRRAPRSPPCTDTSPPFPETPA